MAYDYFTYNITDRCKNYPVNDKLKPGTMYRHSNLKTQILYEIIKKVSGVMVMNLYMKIFINMLLKEMQCGVLIELKC